LRKKSKITNMIAPVADDFSDPESVDISAVYVNLYYAHYLRF
jgi:hypothetical protein